jgi:hypothetical protein
LEPKRTFARIPVKISLLLAGGAIALASFAGAPASGAAHQPGDPARAAQAAGQARAIPARDMALVAYGTPAKPAAGRAATPPRPRPHPYRHRGRKQHGRRPLKHGQHKHRHHKYRKLRQHRGRRHRGHARRHQIHQVPGRPQRIAWSLLTGFHWAHWQFRYLNLLWARESGWNPFATNPYSGAYGIPQALPASKMASAGPDWRSNARTQIRWGMGYIQSTYVTPFRAWLHEVHYGWY